MTSDPPPRDAGVSIAEVLVTLGLFGLLGTLLLGLAMSTGAVTEEIRAGAGVTAESRLAVERMSRELRQASEITAVSMQGTGYDDATPVALTIWVDFDGDGQKDFGVADPEVLTYRWEATTGRLTLTANDPDGTAVTHPVLAEVVEVFDLRLHSSRFEPDADGDGTTTWQELDASSAVGGNRNQVPDGTELRLVDLVSVRMQVADGDVARTFYLQADLRNQDHA